MVHFNTKYPDFATANAAPEGDGVAVLGFLLKAEEPAPESAVSQLNKTGLICTSSMF